ncbi:MAG TPA: RdgB/HAM1 family non-canonical purine NTP pyrophosphatase [Solirubrobacterales bacterium]|nr:RdgB/HAM1 family non-canonical purine NTP pyrophosphatase [Solirubrobacterales bacterium]
MIFATGNKHKLREMRELLPEVELEGLPTGVELPPEDGESFAEIALDKARAAYRATGQATIADDSGIGAVGLDGRPGIYSARYSGEGATDEENLEKLLREVAAAGEERGAYYVCALALIEPDGAEHVFEARCDGHLIERPRGEGGFGYDPAFVPDATGPDDTRTYSEISQEEKNEISHRGRAARLLARHLSAGGAAPAER